MKFNNQREVLARIKAIFVAESAGKTGLSLSGLQTAMTKLHTPLEKYVVVCRHCAVFSRLTYLMYRSDITDIFEVVDLDDSDIIELKEFLVALTVAHALGLIQLSESQKLKPDQPDAAITASQEITANDVKNVCNLILSAYLLFDPTGKGFITKKGVEDMISKGKSKNKEGGNRNLLLNENRWKELVWNIICKLNCIK